MVRLLTLLRARHHLNFSHRSGNASVPEIDWEEPLKLEVKHFVDCVINKTPCLTGVDHAKQVVTVLEQVSKKPVLSETY